MAAPLKFAQSMSVTTRVLLAKFAGAFTGKLKIFILPKIGNSAFREKS